MLARVRNRATGHEYNMSRALAEAPDSGVDLIDRPTHTAGGMEVPPKHAIKPPRARGGRATEADTTEATEEAGA